MDEDVKKEENEEFLQKNKDDRRKMLEAILFATGRFCELDELLKFVTCKDKRELKKILHELQKEYEERNGAIKIIELDNEFKMVVHDNYLEVIRNVLSNMEISKAVLETLAIIAWKKSIIQSDVIKIRGNSAYEHIKELEDLDFITSVKEGVSKRLSLTQKFYDYFNLGGEDLTNKMRREEQERLKILEEEVKRKEEDERKIKEEDEKKRIAQRQEIIDKKKIEMGLSEGQKTLTESVSEKKIENFELKKESENEENQPSQEEEKKETDNNNQIKGEEKKENDAFSQMQ
jgi:segregation and condensation protein B